MLKITILFLSIGLGTVLFPAANQVMGGSYTGDVNCNHRVDVVDAQLLLQLEDGVATLDDPPGESVWCWDKGDVNDDESLDSVDALLILQLDARLISHLPYEEE